MERQNIPDLIKWAGRWVADALIRVSVRGHFQAVYARVAQPPSPDRPAILFANHHYWWDGYLCYLLGKTWSQPMTLWMEEWRWFPPFWALGALPFPEHALHTRARTVRHTVRLLKNPPHVLFIFPEGSIHTGREILPFGRALYWLAQHVPEAQLFPMSIVMTHTRHQYPRAYMHVDRPIALTDKPESWLEQARSCVGRLVDALHVEAECYDTEAKAEQAGFTLLVRGKPSVNERWWARMMP